MLRTFVRLTPNFTIPLLFHNRNTYDNVVTKEHKISNSGWGRVKDMYRISEYGETSKELLMVLQGTFSCAILGAGIGAVLTIKPTYHQFVEKNQNLIYKSMAEAQNRLRKTGFKTLAQGGFFWGWRMCLLSGGLLLVSTTIAVYRDVTPFTEYAVAGAMAGAFLRARASSRAMMDSAALGGLISIIGAIIVTELLKVTLVTNEVTDATDNTSNLRHDQQQATRSKAVMAE